MTRPPVPRFRLSVTIEANSHEEIETELGYIVSGGYLRDSNSHQRDNFIVASGKTWRRLDEVNPDMTPEKYDAELMEWWEAKRG